MNLHDLKLVDNSYIIASRKVVSNKAEFGKPEQNSSFLPDALLLIKKLTSALLFGSWLSLRGMIFEI